MVFLHPSNSLPASHITPFLMHRGGKCILNEGWKYLNMWCTVKYDYIISLGLEMVSAFTKLLTVLSIGAYEKCYLEKSFSLNNSSGINWRWVIMIDIYNDIHWTNVKSVNSLTQNQSHLEAQSDWLTKWLMTSR